MTKEEIAEIMQLPVPELARACLNPETLVTVLSIVYQQGISLGQEQTHKSYNQMFRGYNEVDIKN